MSLGITHLSQSITPNTAGIIWLTDEELNYKTPGVYEFNYLLNGVLINFLANQDEIKNKNTNRNYFLSDNFGKPIFVAHVQLKNKDDFEKIYDHLNISESFFNEKTKIYIFNKSQNTANLNVLKSLSEKYNHIKFENLNI